MVVRKVMRWSPWAPTAATSKRKYRVTVAVARVDGLCQGSAAAADDGGSGEAPRAVAVEIRWKGPPRGRGLSYLRGRRKLRRCLLAERPVREGAAEWGAEEDASVFDHVCGFSAAERDGSFGALDVSFHLLSVKGEKKLLGEIGTAMLNLGELASQLGSGEEKESSERTQITRELPVALRAIGSAAHARLSVSISFVETKSIQEMSEPALPEVAGGERINPKAESDDQQATGQHSCVFHSDASDETRQQLRTSQVTATAGEDGTADWSTCSGSSTDAEGGNTSIAGSASPPKRGFLSWRKRRRKNHDGDGGEARRERTGASAPSNSSTSLEDKVREEESTPIPPDSPGNQLLTTGSWEEKELISRDGQTKLKASIFFASIDQRDESAGGESACTALVVVIADALQYSNQQMPTSSQLDALIREGSSAWRKLCEEESYTDRFPDKHFDLETVLDARLRPVSVSPENSFVGFFQPDSFESLRGAMSFDDIWKEISCSVEDGCTKVYIVSWNDHFFLLKVEADAFYVIDTLGERLFEGCDKAYILRFDDSASVSRLPEQQGSEQDPICSGKDCCREFVNRFLAAIPLSEELEKEEKRGEGPGINALHQRLQIEFHLVKRASGEGRRVS